MHSSKPTAATRPDFTLRRWHGARPSTASIILSGKRNLCYGVFWTLQASP
jgi:hypothetical protein